MDTLRVFLLKCGVCLGVYRVADEFTGEHLCPCCNAKMRLVREITA